MFYTMLCLMRLQPLSGALDSLRLKGTILVTNVNWV